MVLAYACSEHGIQDECGVSEDGERLCPQCEQSVVAITGEGRDTTASPPEGEANYAEGDIEWIVERRTAAPVYLSAFDVNDALSRAAEKMDNPQSIREVRPRNRQYARL